MYSHIPIQILDAPAQRLIFNQIEQNEQRVALIEKELGRPLTEDELVNAFHICDSWCNCSSID